MKRWPKRKTLLLSLLSLLLLTIGWQLLRGQFSADEREARTSVREILTQYFPDQALLAEEQYGLKRYSPAHRENSTTGQVILVHGLDDPGRVWMNLAPLLHTDGYEVWIFLYPDDQPIEASARFFRTELAKLHKQGIKQVSLIAHSMGGLVSREMLTSQPHEHTANIPVIDKLIMVGTPNHGSELARFRLFAEIRDHAANLLNPDAGWLAWIFDGAGEAGIDLIPGSDFLTNLNKRPHSPETRLIVIAAVLSRVDQMQLESMLTKYQDRVPDLAHDSFKRLTEILNRISQELGDGLVSLESAHLEGAENHLVEGTHLSMIRNISTSSERMPPAIPIILQQLRDD